MAIVQLQIKYFKFFSLVYTNLTYDEVSNKLKKEEEEKHHHRK